jgi:hypothetical protein
MINAGLTLPDDLHRALGEVERERNLRRAKVVASEKDLFG